MRDDFVDRVGSMVHGMSKAGLVTADEWWEVAEELHEYLGALSVGPPGLGTPVARAALDDAAEAAAGAVAYAAYYSKTRFRVFLDYIDFGMSYEPHKSREDESRTVTAWQWLDAFCLAVLAGRAEHHGEAFHFAREPFQEGEKGRPAGELVNGFMAHVLGDTGNEADSYPPTREERLAAIAAALNRVRALDDELGGGLVEDPRTTALHALRALLSDDEQGFQDALADLLVSHAAAHESDARPGSLLPLLPLALAALAHREAGWRPAVDTEYLPRELVTGFADAGPRVRAFGRNRRPDAVAELAAAGRVVLERPALSWSPAPGSVRYREELTARFFASGREEPVSLLELVRTMDSQYLLFQWRAAAAPDVTDEQLGNLSLAARLGAAAFRAVRAGSASPVDLTVNGVTLACVAEPGTRPVRMRHWHTAMGLALVTGERDDLAPLVLVDPTSLPKGLVSASYCEALRQYLRGEDPRAAVERAVQNAEEAKGWGLPPSPAVLLSQLVEGDEESFNLALLDVLEAHRDHYAVADPADDSESVISLGIVGLACHARRRGWDVRVDTPYLPARLLRNAGGA